VFKIMTAQTRLLAMDQEYETDYVNNNKDMTWQREMDHKYKGKPRTPGRVLPEDTFTKSPSEIAHILKQNSEDYQQAMSKLSSYINRQGRNLQGADKERLLSAKDALRNAYGEQNEPATASSELPIYPLPPGHNLDDGYLETGIDCDPDKRATEPVTDPAVPLNAMTRLAASLQNTVQNEGTDTFISKVEAEENPDSDIARTLKRVSEQE
jgi:Protein of unknown function (DUF3175)